jgi:D-aminoacyl-tRNA deacylase
MRACIQRVLKARVVVEGEVVGEIDRGLLVLLGVSVTDTDTETRWMAEKIAGLRIFDDPDGKMNLSLTDVGGSMLVVSQFTLYGDCRKGRRPSFISAAGPNMANALYQAFIAMVEKMGITTASGRFQTHMEVELTNDGPVTIWIDTQDK